VRNGCFCAHPYLFHLLQLPEEQVTNWSKRILNGDKADKPGLVRISFGCYNNTDDIDRVIEMLNRIVRGDYQGDYRMNPHTGEYIPANYHEPIHQYFALEPSNESSSEEKKLVSAFPLP
jgi:hypothetical protein